MVTIWYTLLKIQAFIIRESELLYHIFKFTQPDRSNRFSEKLTFSRNSIKILDFNLFFITHGNNIRFALTFNF